MKEKEPYFKGQLPAECGCYYPDITLVRDDPKRKERILFCINHGEYSIPLGKVTEPLTDPNPRPTEEWREEERLRLRSGG